MNPAKLNSPTLADVTLVRVSRLESAETVLAVVVDNHEWGTISKFRNTRTEINPWKAYRGKPGRYVTSFYKEDGGVEAAVACVLDRRLTK
jgi:hypothetical protein